MGAKKSKPQQNYTPYIPPKAAKQFDDNKKKFEIPNLAPRSHEGDAVLVICSNSFNDYFKQTFEKCHAPWKITFIEGSRLFNDFSQNPHDIEKFDAILVDVFCNSIMDIAAVSSFLVEYSNSGRGLVLCCATNCSKFPNHSLQGDFRTLGYHPLEYSDKYFNSSTQNPVKLGSIHEQHHPILTGVKSFELSKNPEYVFCNIHKDATRIADFDVGEPMIACKLNPKGTGMLLCS